MKHLFSSKIQRRVAFLGVMLIVIGGGSLWYVNYKTVQILTDQMNLFATAIDPIFSARVHAKELTRSIEELGNGFEDKEEARKKIEANTAALQENIRQIRSTDKEVQLISQKDLTAVSEFALRERQIGEEILNIDNSSTGKVNENQGIVFQQIREKLQELDKVDADLDTTLERLTEDIVTWKNTSSVASSKISSNATRASGGLTALVVLVIGLAILWLMKKLKESYVWLEGENSVLLASEKKFKDLVENITDLVWELDAQGVLTYGNPEIKDILGYDPDEYLGKNFLDFIPKDEREKVGSTMKEATEKKSALYGMEIEALHKDGRKVDLEVDMLPLFDEKGGARGFRGIARDVTERKKGETKIKELNDLRSRFIQIISHQLRTPLGSMRWSIETLLEEKLGPLTDGQKEFVHMIYDADVSVLGRVNDLLVVMDIEEGRIAMQKESIAIDSLFASVIGEFTKKAEAKKIKFTWHGPKDLLPAQLADPNKMRQVFEKLIENAVIHTPDGGTIVATLTRLGERIRFEITDTGVGIPAVEQKNIFKSFFRASNAFLIRPDASGVGLAITKYFVEQHGGTIGFTSEEGKGSTFWFEIPIME